MRLSELDTNISKGLSEWVSKYITYLQAQTTRIVGTPEQITDQIEQWQAAGVDGVNVINWVIPGSFEEFADKVLPVLRERGLAQHEYSEATLRPNLFWQGSLHNERHPAAGYRGACAQGPQNCEETSVLGAEQLDSDAW